MRSKYLTPKQVAGIRQKGEPALVQERKRGIGPPYIRDGGRILYPEDTLYAWLDARLVNTGTVPAPSTRRTA
jgi:hypothetical protein